MTITLPEIGQRNWATPLLEAFRELEAKAEAASGSVALEGLSKVTVPAGQMLGNGFGSPSLGIAGRFTVWLLDPTVPNEGLSSTIAFPDHWSTFNIDVVWVNLGAGSGTIRVRTDFAALVDGSTDLDPPSGGGQTVVANAQNVVTRTRTNSGLTSPNGLGGFELIRFGSHAEDTLPNDIGIVAVVFTQAS